jgi:hypothetical protein
LRSAPFETSPYLIEAELLVKTVNVIMDPALLNLPVKGESKKEIPNALSSFVSHPAAL